MNARKLEFRVPRLRKDVVISSGQGDLTLEYRDQGCDLGCPPPVRPELKRALSLLKRGSAIAELERAAPTLAGQLPEILKDLDRLGLLVEVAVAKPLGDLTGREFYRQLRRFAERVMRRSAHNRFYRALKRGEVTADQLIGYAIEYYHLVHYAPRLIAPALAHSDTARTHAILTDFLTSELGHDRMLLDSLQAVGIRESQLQYVMPLPSTFSLISGLGVFAAQEPLTFKSTLFLYEEADGRFNDAFKLRCQQTGLPEGFYGPIARHAQLNDDHDHGDISKLLLDEIPSIGAEEQVVIKKQVAVTIETLVFMEDEILQHYGSPGVLPPLA